ncbi:MAG: hypothetical protein U0K19_02830 [Bifidobacteriaceae bacterium]|nr:hypothetical protein [Bifidobacteriaceae bacterium]
MPAITVNRATEICDLMITVSPAIGNAVCSAPMDHNSFSPGTGSFWATMVWNASRARL